MRRAEAQMAVANQQMYDSKRLALLGNSNLLLKLTARDKRLVRMILCPWTAAVTKFRSNQAATFSSA